jgi:hypothetical protein
MTPKNMEKFMPLFSGMIAKYNDPNANAKTNIEALEKQRKALVEQTKAYNKAEAAYAKRELKVNESQLREQYSSFRPENAKQNYARRAQEMTSASQWMYGMGMTDQAEGMERQAFEMLERAIASGAAGNMIQLYKRDLNKEGKAVGAGKATYDTVNETYGMRDEEGNQIDLAHLPADLTTVKPTETFGKKTGAGAAGQKGLMTEFQMSNVKAYYESEGVMGGIVGSDPVKPKIRQMSTIITKIHAQDPKYAGAAETRALARAEIIQAVEAYEAAYWQIVDKALAKSPSERKRLITLLGGTPSKKMSNAQQIKNLYYLQFRDGVRSMFTDEKDRKSFEVYRPNSTTRKMTLGVSGMGDK